MAMTLPFLETLLLNSNDLSDFNEVMAFKDHKSLKVLDLRDNLRFPYINKRLILLQHLLLDGFMSNLKIHNTVSYLQSTYEHISH